MFILLYIILILFLFFYINKALVEPFLVRKRLPIAVTWTPYVYDYVNQPAYSNYFFDNGYMYPIY